MLMIIQDTSERLRRRIWVSLRAQESSESAKIDGQGFVFLCRNALASLIMFYSLRLLLLLNDI